MDLTIWDLAQIPHEVGACFTAGYPGIFAKIRVLELLATRRGVLGSIKEHLDGIERNHRKPYEMRNRFVHDPWFMEKETQEIAQHRAQSKEGKEVFFGMKERQEDEVRNTIKKIEKLTEQDIALRQIVLEL